MKVLRNALLDGSFLLDIHAFLNTPGVGDSNAGIIAARAEVAF